MDHDYESWVSVSGHTDQEQVHGSTCHLVYIPGNPGVPGLCQNYVESVMNKLDPQFTWKATILGFKGHTQSKMWSMFKIYSLKDQINHVS